MIRPSLISILAAPQSPPIYRLLTTIFDFLLLWGGFLLIGCSPKFDPKHTYSVEQLRADYGLMRSALEEAHPGLYRYTSRDSMNLIFDQTALQLNRPMTEQEFRKAVNQVFNYIRCGHTDIYPSKGFTQYYKKNKPKEFPLSVFIDHNRPFVTQNRSTDTTIKAGMELIAIDNHPTPELLAQMRDLVPSDGYNQTFKNSVVNASFGSFYRFLYGNNDTFKVSLKDSTGKILERTLTFNTPAKTTPKPTPKPSSPPAVPITTPAKPTPKPISSNKKRTFNLSDKDSTVGILSIKTFSDNHYQRFYRKTFKKIKQHNIQHLVIDIRANGGGRSDASINLMSYLLDSAFVVYDTIDGQSRRPSFNKHYNFKFYRFVSRNFLAKKLPNGHFRNRGAGKIHQPNKKWGFRGNVYVLTNGGSFSASAIFASVVRQNSPRVTIIGRETGGGRHGCNAFISPYVTLPYTRAKVRLPVYKLVLHIPGADMGRGVMPDAPVTHRFDDVQKGRDLDMDKAYQLITKKPQP